MPYCFPDEVQSCDSRWCAQERARRADELWLKLLAQIQFFLVPQSTKNVVMVRGSVSGISTLVLRFQVAVSSQII